MIANQFYSFHYSQVPGLEKLHELARQHSYAPTSIDPLRFLKLRPEDPLVARRQSLDDLPDEEAILQHEFELASKNKSASPLPAPKENAADIESSRHAEILARLDRKPAIASALPTGDPQTRQLKHRVGSGSIKLDERPSRLAELIQAVSECFGEPCRCQGDYWYPQGGFRDWRTNKFDTPGWRLYIIDTDQTRRSYFRLKHPTTNEVITVWDEPGTFNFFLIDPRRLLWHCIGSPEANRWSKGFVIPNTLLDTVVARIDSSDSS